MNTSIRTGHSTRYEFSMPLMVDGANIGDIEIKCDLGVCGPHDALEVDHISDIKVQGFKKEKDRLDSDYVWVSVPDWLNKMASDYLDGGGHSDMDEHIYERYAEDAN